MNREIKKNLKEAKSSGRKIVEKAQQTAIKNAKLTVREVLEEIQPEVAKIRSDFKNVVKAFRKKVS
jgi:hypothetical protein